MSNTLKALAFALVAVIFGALGILAGSTYAPIGPVAPDAPVAAPVSAPAIEPAPIVTPAPVDAAEATPEAAPVDASHATVL